MTAAQTSPKLTRLGPYPLLTELHLGGTATAHLGTMDGPGGSKKLVIVKELRADAAAADELRRATRLTHPNVAHTCGVHEEHGKLYFATEYLDGQPWSRVRRALEQRNALSEALQLQVLLEVLSGLHYAHELRDHDDKPWQMVHGNVSPRNVVVTYEGLVKLADFGVAHAGKLTYSAPEQARADAFDRRADIFAVGVMLWEALARRPYAQSEDEAELRRIRSSGLEPRVRTIAPDAPPALADICDRALALAPEDRFATASEFRDALRGHVGEDVRDSDRAQLGKLVQAAFQEERAALHAIIERHLRPANPAATARKLTSAPLARTQPVSPAGRPAPSARVHAVGPLHLRNRVSLRELRRGRVPLLVIGVALLSFAITWLISRPEPQAVAPSAQRETRRPVVPSHRQPAPPEAATSVNASTDPDPATPPSSMHLTITAHPASAMLYLDGVPVSDNPFSASVSADHQLHTIRASGTDLTPEERVIRFDRDQAISLDLAPRFAHSVPATLHLVRKPQRPSAAPAEKAATPADANSGTRQRARSSDLFDAPLVIGKTLRPIYEDDPYPRKP